MHMTLHTTDTSKILLAYTYTRLPDAITPIASNNHRTRSRLVAWAGNSSCQVQIRTAANTTWRGMVDGHRSRKKSPVAPAAGIILLDWIADICTWQHTHDNTYMFTSKSLTHILLHPTYIHCATKTSCPEAQPTCSFLTSHPSVWVNWHGLQRNTVLKPNFCHTQQQHTSHAPTPSAATILSHIYTTRKQQHQWMIDQHPNYQHAAAQITSFVQAQCRQHQK